MTSRVIRSYPFTLQAGRTKVELPPGHRFWSIVDLGGGTAALRYETDPFLAATPKRYELYIVTVGEIYDATGMAYVGSIGNFTVFISQTSR